jgi:hypothetical protein
MRRNPKEYGMYWEEYAGCPERGLKCEITVACDVEVL